MGWIEPQRSKAEVNGAGRVLVRTVYDPLGADPHQWEAFDKAIDTIDNWRASHSFPLNTIQMNLRKSAHR